MTSRSEEGCRVCRDGRPRPFCAIRGLAYWRCDTCGATLLDAAHLPDPEAERARYALHVNDPDDAGYRRFLSQLAEPLLARLPPAQRGLDYGCGNGPALAMMLRDAGHAVRLYDPFFYPDPAALEGLYDFVTCTEVVEHFHRPAEEFARLDRLTRPGGWLAFMTCFQTDDGRFANWSYRRDDTHVVFYREETFRYLAGQYGWRCEIPAPNVALMRKPEGAAP